MNSTEKTNLKQPTLLQTLGAILVAAVMWGSGNVLSRSLLIEGGDKITKNILSYKLADQFYLLKSPKNLTKNDKLNLN